MEEKTKLELDDEDMRALYLIIDMGLKAGGLQAYQAASRILARIPVEEQPKKEKEEEVEDVG